MNIPLINVTIRRDAHTITNATVAPYELLILRQMFGKENVQDVTSGPAVTFEADPNNEFERLCAKYGAEKVTKVYGDDNGARLAELVEKSVAKEPTKRAAKAEAAE